MITHPATALQPISREAIALIEEHLRRLLEVMGFSAAEVNGSLREGKNFRAGEPYLYLAIKSTQSGRLLIGAHGSHLNALQHLIRAIIRRHLGYPLRVTVDVNGYIATRERTLLQLAEEAARKAGRSGRSVTLPPMVASERHLIHNVLASRPDINTASLGEEPNRRVIVRPVFI